MSSTEVQVEPDAGGYTDPVSTNGSGQVVVAAFALAAGAVVAAVLTHNSAAPLLLTVLTLLAGLGLFFIFGLAAGHVRLTPRVAEADIVRAATEALDRGLLVAADDGTPLYVNGRMRTLAGIDGGLSAGILERLVGNNAAGQSALFRLNRAAMHKEAASADFDIPAPLGVGATRVVRISVGPFVIPGHERDVAHGRLSVWSVDDVTAERRSADAVRAAFEAKLAHFDQAPAGLLVAGSDGSIPFINATLRDWLGLSTAQPELTLGDVFPADGVELLKGLVGQAADRPVAIDLDLTRDDGRILPARLVCRSTAVGGVRTLAIAVMSGEVGGSALGPQDARAVEERFTRFFQSAPFGIATVSADGTIGSPNGAFSRMILDGTGGLGRQALAVLGRDADQETRTAIDAGLRHVLSGRGNVTPIEVPVGTDKTQVRRVYMNPLTATATNRESAILYVIDATEHKALEAKFAQSSKMEAVGKLAGGIAHDFNNMLTAILGFSDILLAMHRPTDLAYMDLRNIKSSAERAAGLVGKLLAFSRQQTLLKETLQLGEVLTDLAPLLKRSIGEKIDLKMTTGRDLWPVKTDKIQLEQAVINLAVNARDAMPGGGTLVIRSRNVNEREVQKLGHLGMTIGEYALIEVEDSGTGMSPEVLSKIFEPFFTTKGVGKGTGLGLATVYGIIKQTGGYIFCDSTPGKGTTFRVYLPRHHIDAEEVAQTQKAIAAQKQLKPADLTGTGRVLLVEDEDVVRSFAVRALKSRGYEVLEAASGVEALEVMAACNGEVDIVVSDVVMPEMDGPTLLKELRAKNPDIKIIFVSGYPNEAFKQQLDENEAFAFLPKPFSLPQLAAKVKEELGR